VISLRCLMVLSFFWFSSCEEEKSREEARFQREVDQRVEVIRSEMKVSEGRWHTVRIVCFSLLAGGSLIWLFNGGVSPGGVPMLPDGKSREYGYRGRVIDRPYDDDDEPDSHPYRR
jgi:hypothetical protein